MQYEVLDVTRQEHALLITLNRPDALNALNARTIEELHHFFTTGFEQHGQFTAVILTGAGEKAFAAGADISEFTKMDADLGLAFAKRGQKTFFAIEQFHTPVIAAVNGYALGGGCELAMACHMRLASENARFGQPEVNLGLIPGYGGTQRLIQLLGKGKAMQLMLTGEMLSADDALTGGLVNAVVSQEELIPTCLALVQKISKKGPVAISRIIRSVNAYFEEGKNGFEAEVQNFRELMDTEDFHEGIAAFLEKRPAIFSGH